MLHIFHVMQYMSHKKPHNEMITTTMQMCIFFFISGVLVFFGVICFSVGKGNLSSTEAIGACGLDGSGCQYGWAFILAIIAVLDGIALGILAFILAIKQDKLEADMTYSDYSRPNGKIQYGVASIFLDPSAV